MAKKKYTFIDLFAGENTGQVVTDIRSIIEQGRKMAYAAAGQAAIATYWNIGRRIVEEEQRGDQRAEYGAQLIATLSDQLQSEYGRGYSRRNLAYYRNFYLSFKDLEILHTCVQVPLAQTCGHKRQSTNP